MVSRLIVSQQELAALSAPHIQLSEYRFPLHIAVPQQQGLLAPMLQARQL